MNAPLDDRLADDARLWAIRLRDPAFADWDAFIAWLEADAAHNPAYEAALAELDAADALFDVPPAPAWAAAPEPVHVTANDVDTVRPLPRWRLHAVAACAAAVAVVGGWFAIENRSPARLEYATAAGERRTIALADGSRIVLNGGTRLSLDPGNPRDVAMAEGEAVFDVRHDASRPFVITTAGGTRLVDVGTRFNVDTKDGALAVAVAEGAVMYQGGRSAGGDIRLDAGKQLSRASLDAMPVTRDVPRDEVGTWQSGQRHYSDAPLGEVAADLSRNIGVPVAVDEAVSGRRFSGTITLDGDATAVMARIAPVLDVGTRKEKHGWRLIRPNDANP